MDFFATPSVVKAPSRILNGIKTGLDLAPELFVKQCLF